MNAGGNNMLIEFNVGNFLSFKDKITFSMVASPVREHLNHVFDVKKGLKLLKCATVYGANASGKSNLFRAISFMSDFVQNSSKDSQAEEKINVDNFKLSTETDNQPSSFEISFMQNKIQYRYGFKVNPQKVVSEWLYYTPKNQEIKLFERDENVFEITDHFVEGKDLDKKTRNNALFLSVVAQFNGDKSINILKWFNKLNTISGLNDKYKDETADLLEEILKDGMLKQVFLDLMKLADVGIEEININKQEVDMNKLPKKIQKAFLEYKEKLGKDVLFYDLKTVKTLHKKFDSNNKPISLEEFEMYKHESHGTQKLFSLLGPILDALQSGKILIIDEFDSRLHTLLTSFIMKLFNSNEINPYNAQLVTSTHDTNLLSNRFFRRDQIWFVEKDRYGSTDLYSLLEYKVRSDASFEKDYLLGKYGAIPYIGEFKFFSNKKDGIE